jgi:hypothetical protein
MGDSDTSTSAWRREFLRSDAARRRWRWAEIVRDTIGGEYLHIEVRNRHGYPLTRGRGICISPYNPDFEDVDGLDWDVELDAALTEAFRVEKRREAQRLRTRLSRAWIALGGSVDVPVPDPKRDRRPRRDVELERDLRNDRGLSRRQARKVARQIQAGIDREDALAQIGAVTSDSPAA